MALPVIADVYRVALHWQSATTGQNGVNVMHFSAPGGTTAGVGNTLDANVTANMWAGRNNACSVNQLSITKLDGSTATNIKAVSGAKWTGNQASEWVPAAATIISLRTNLRGPSRRGRLFLPFTAELAMADGIFDATQLAAAQAAWNTFLTAMSTASTTLVVASYKFSTAQTVTSVIVDSILGTVRKRQTRLR